MSETRRINALKLAVKALMGERHKFAFDHNLFMAGINTIYSERASQEYIKRSQAIEVIQGLILELEAARNEQKTSRESGRSSHGQETRSRTHESDRGQRGPGHVG